MAIHSSVLAWRIPGTGAPGGLPSMGSQSWARLKGLSSSSSSCGVLLKGQQWPQGWKRSILMPVPKKGSTKECTNHWTIALISYASKVMVKSCMLLLLLLLLSRFSRA